MRSILTVKTEGKVRRRGRGDVQITAPGAIKKTARNPTAKAVWVIMFSLCFQRFREGEGGGGGRRTKERR